jgi:hypothetical protein
MREQDNSHPRPRKTSWRHRNLANLALLGPCYMCEGDNDPCTSGEVSGYATCADCHRSTGPEQRNCLPCYLQEYASLVDAKGFAPYFAVLGNVEIVGSLRDARTAKVCRGARVRLLFPNGLSLETRTDKSGSFRLHIASSNMSARHRAAASIDIGQHPYRKSDAGFVLGFQLDAPKRALNAKVPGLRAGRATR